MGCHDHNRLKAALEFYLLMLVFFAICIFGIESADLINQINRVHLFKDYLVNTIDNHHVFDENVVKVMEQNKICKDCVYSVRQEDNRYYVDVYFNLQLRSINLEIPLHLKSFSNMVF